MTILKGEIIYKCRLCGERFKVGNDTSAINENESIIHRLSKFEKDVLFMRHECNNNGRIGIADAIGWVRDGK